MRGNHDVDGGVHGQSRSTKVLRIELLRLSLIFSARGVRLKSLSRRFRVNDDPDRRASVGDREHVTEESGCHTILGETPAAVMPWSSSTIESWPLALIRSLALWVPASVVTPTPPDCAQCREGVHMYARL